MANDHLVTDEQVEELAAAMYILKTSENEVELKESAKTILFNHMDVSGVRKILTTHQTSIILSKDSASQDMATDVAQKSFMNIIAELFINSFRMGMLEQQNEYRKMIVQIQNEKVSEVIGIPAEDVDEHSEEEKEQGQ